MTTPRRWLVDGVMDVEGLAVLAAEEEALHAAMGADHYHHPVHHAGQHRGQVPTSMRIWAFGGSRQLEDLGQTPPIVDIGPWHPQTRWGGEPQTDLVSVPAPDGWEIVTARLHLRSTQAHTRYLAPTYTSPELWRWGYGPLPDMSPGTVPPAVSQRRFAAAQAIILLYLRPLR